MSDMDVRHDEVVIPNDGVITFACGTVDCHVFTQLNAVAHDYTGGLAFELMVLWGATENNAGLEDAILTNRYILFEYNMCKELSVIPNRTVWTDDAERSDLNTVPHHRGCIYDRSRMYHSTHSATSRS